ncbi:nuclear transport factor 2 family protein [Solitalea sp. MAHUQ-68]|uniref:Nuclear transport factor 2 family protein n=1 Tax=Solitalea agri TaxID=2953739 RepID=A0A9X2JD26_9SPHI|nr:nuclear transport factor 2 family protein [Solitalea agri]MCO4293154.1 nuclear transport factor 2 family protein [Solitalea agri]
MTSSGYFKILFIVFNLLLTFTNGFSQSVPDYIKELTDREKQFAQLAAEKGIKASFMSVLYEDGIVFRPEPVNGLNYFKQLPDGIDGILSWEPVFADVSNDQTLGYTTGPFEYKNESNGVTNVNYGQYVSIWIKPKKKWELMVDLGIAHSKPSFVPQFAYANPMTFGMKRSTFDFVAEEQQKNTMEVLKATDELYCSALNINKTESSYKEYLSREVRLLRNNSLPILGKAAAMKFLLDQTAMYNYKSTKVYAAPSRDLGYTIGIVAITTLVNDKQVVNSYNYVRIWRKENAGYWRVVLDIEAPIPAKEEQE